MEQPHSVSHELERWLQSDGEKTLGSPHRDLAAAALASARAGRRQAAAVHRGSDEDDPQAGALLQATPAVPVAIKGIGKLF
jgi:hypothetical protein